MCHPRGDHVWPVWTSRVGPKWVHGGAQMGIMCLACMAPLWPPGQFCLGRMWAAHKGPFGPPSWGPSVTRMDCLCGAHIGPLWGPDGSQVYHPYGPIVAPWRILSGPHMWAAHKERFGPPAWGPPVARMDCSCRAQMGPWWGPDGSHVSRPYGPIMAPWPIMSGSHVGRP